MFLRSFQHFRMLEEILKNSLIGIKNVRIVEGLVKCANHSRCKHSFSPGEIKSLSQIIAQCIHRHPRLSTLTALDVAWTRDNDFAEHKSTYAYDWTVWSGGEYPVVREDNFTSVWCSG